MPDRTGSDCPILEEALLEEALRDEALRDEAKFDRSVGLDRPAPAPAARGQRDADEARADQQQRARLGDRLRTVLTASRLRCAGLGGPCLGCAYTNASPVLGCGGAVVALWIAALAKASGRAQDQGG